MIRLLFVKLLRTIYINVRQFIALVIFVMVAMSLFNGLGKAYGDLELSINRFYENTGFADYIITVPIAPESLVDQLTKIEGVEKVTARIQSDIQIKRTNGERISGRLISYGEIEEQNVSRLSLMDGESFSSDPKKSDLELLIGYSFFNRNSFTIGEKVDIYINGILGNGHVLGSATSAELANLTRKPGNILEGNTFGPVMVTTKQAQKFLGMTGKVNQFLIHFRDNVSSATVIERINKEISVYNPISSVKKEDHPAIVYNDSVLSGMKSVSLFFPLIFYINAMIFLYILIRQQIKSQRREIGILKALGLSNSAISILYISYAVIITVVGGLLGIQLSRLFTYLILNKCKEILELPTVYHSPDIYAVVGIIICIIVGSLSGLLSTKQITKISPAEAIRGRQNAKSKNKSFIRIDIPCLTEGWRMSIRSMLRNKLRFTITTLGLLTSSMLLFGSLSFIDSKTYLLNHYFEKENSYDYYAVFKTPVKKGSLQAWEAKPYVEAIESLLETPIVVYKDENNKNVGKGMELLNGIDPESSLKLPFSEDSHKINLINDGIALSQTTAKKIGVTIGDMVTLELMTIQGEWIKANIKVTDICDHYLMRNSFTTLETLNKLIGTEDMVNEILILSNKVPSESLVKALQKDDSISYFQASSDVSKLAEDSFGGIVIAAVIIIFCAILMGFALVYNVSLMGYAERLREFAVLRVIGYYVGDVSKLLFNELLLQILLAIPLSLPLGRIISESFLDMVSSENTVYPHYIYIRTYLFTVFCVIGFSVIAHFLSMIRVKKMDFCEATRVKE